MPRARNHAPPIFSGGAQHRGFAAQNAISILPATKSAIPAILNFIHQLAKYEKLSHQVKATKSDLRKHLFGPQPAAEAIIARLGKTPVGYALFFTTFSTFAGQPGIWLEDLFVLPAHRRAGIGRVLLRSVAAIALKRKCARLEWSVLDWNAPAIKLYRKLGAKALDDWTTQRLTGRALVRLARKT
jgi:GNAT superfamily N-acetyltransferase